MDITTGPLHEKDLPDAERIFRLAFGTWEGIPDPETYGAGRDFIRTRWNASPIVSLGAFAGGRVVGSIFAAGWGSVGVVGPLTVHPDLWDRGVASRLLEHTMEILDRRGLGHVGLSTYANSEKHIGLYQKFGFWPRFLTAIMSIPTGDIGLLREEVSSFRRQVKNFSDASEKERGQLIARSREVTCSIYDGLDLEFEIRSIHSQSLGDTLTIGEESTITGFAVCHCGTGSEAGDGTCYVKFGAVRPGPDAGKQFEDLLAVAMIYARNQGMAQLVAGVNAGRQKAYQAMIKYGFRVSIGGVAMHRPNEPAYNRPGIFVLDDWR